MENRLNLEKNNKNECDGKVNINKLIGMRVWNKNTNSIGSILDISDGIITISFHGDIRKFAYPDSFSNILELEDENIHEIVHEEGLKTSFEDFKKLYRSSIRKEIEFLKTAGGRKYKIFDGELLITKTKEYLYAFDTDTELHFPNDTVIKLWFSDRIVQGYIISCDDFSILIRTKEYIGKSIESVDMTSEHWQLMEALMERLDELNPNSSSIAYELATNGKSQISKWKSMKCGQNIAFNNAISERITFIWGPPGTGKTEILSRIAIEHINMGRRVLMLSYSNVSVDGALLRVVKKNDFSEGMIVRYGYPRIKELLENEKYTSYQYVIKQYPKLYEEYHILLEKKNKLNKSQKNERNEINNQINRIREFILDKEKKLIQKAAFVATTVSKATVDSAIYMQSFDVVIFDEASMAYVPQIVFSAGLAKSYFVCLGDFCQLPAIVQNKAENRLTRDIFEYTGIATAVENEMSHNWLVMLDLQYRMHYDISSFVSKNMYHGLLKSSPKITESREEISMCPPCPGASMSMVDLSHMYSVCTKTGDGSRINFFSALISLRIAEKNINRYEICIITPYSAQSRLILSMIRDIQERNVKWSNVSCATVHQFQGSEKNIIIFDSVDCFRMPYPGMLLTSMNNDTANRLFNVVITRAKGKFVLVSNVDYLRRKNISKKLLFSKAINEIEEERNYIKGDSVLNEIISSSSVDEDIYIDEREKSWEYYIGDIKLAQKKIHIDIPDVIEENEKLINQLADVFGEKEKEGVNIFIRITEDIDLPINLRKYVIYDAYVTNPVTIIDDNIIWFGQPLYAADFISEGEFIDTEFFPCIRFEGKHTVRSVQTFLEIKKMEKE